MAISRMQMNRQLRAGGGIMDVTPREKFGLGSKLKKFVRKVIPNEVAEVATKAAPFVAPFNPLLAAGMAGVGGFDKSGSISGALRSGALTYGLGNLARVVGGAGFQAGLKAPGTGTGFGSYFTSPMSGQQLFGARPPVDPTISRVEPLGIEELAQQTGTVDKLPQSVQKDIIAQDLFSKESPTSYKNLLGKVIGRDATLAERTQAIKDLGGKAIKDIYTTDEGKIDKFSVAATVGGVTSYVEAKKLAEEADLVDDADEYTEEMYEADKAKYAEKYGEYLTPEAFGLKEGGRVKLQIGGIPSITLKEIKAKDPKDYNFMELIDTDAEDEYYRKRAEELDREYNPQNYMVPKEKPIQKYLLDEVMSERGMNSLSEDTREMFMRELAVKAFKKGQISEAEYNEIMGIEEKAEGGIMGVRNKYAMGSEVPIRENQAGVSEMDFRQTGGFVPPIGVKEKADDIPAMLSNNEFVFTADAVRAAGGGSVNKGAQKMYNLMKSLENKVV